jgi:sarcosine oxidase, subunit beta
VTISDVAVIGAGIAGAGAAFRLADRGVKTTIIERTFPAAGPTGKSSAIIHAFYLMPALSQLAIRGCEILARIPELTGHASCVSKVGMMWAVNEEARFVWAAAVDRIRAGGARIETLSVAQFGRRAPGFALDRIAMAVWEPDYGYADPHGATTALIDGAKQRGARILNNSVAAKIHVTGGRVSGIETSAGQRIACDAAICALGVWSKPFFADHGIDLPVHIERHPMAVIDAPGRALEVMPFSWCDDTMLHYARPDGDSRILVGTWAGGGTGIRHGEMGRPRSVSDPDSYDEVVGLEESAEILQYALPRIPALERLGVRKGYAGLYDMSPDDNPIIDAVPGIEGLYVICGSSGHGFKLGPAVGEAAADWVMGRRPALLDAFRLARFTR